MVQNIYFSLCFRRLIWFWQQYRGIFIVWIDFKIRIVDYFRCACCLWEAINHFSLCTEWVHSIPNRLWTRSFPSIFCDWCILHGFFWFRICFSAVLSSLRSNTVCSWRTECLVHSFDLGTFKVSRNILTAPTSDLLWILSLRTSALSTQSPRRSISLSFL